MALIDGSRAPGLRVDAYSYTAGSMLVAATVGVGRQVAWFVFADHMCPLDRGQGQDAHTRPSTESVGGKHAESSWADVENLLEDVSDSPKIHRDSCHKALTNSS